MSGVDALGVFPGSMDGCYSVSNLTNPRDDNNFIYTKYMEEDGPMFISFNTGDSGMWTLGEFPYDADFSQPLDNIRLTDEYSLISSEIDGDVYSPADAEMWGLVNLETIETDEAPDVSVVCGCDTIIPIDSPTASPTTASPTTATFTTASPTTASFTTASPTGSPTSSLTRSIPEVTSEAPTGSPTGSPMMFSTEAPTGSPTGSPMMFSTETPTGSPTGSPTMFSTETPTGSPTGFFDDETFTGSPTGSGSDERGGDFGEGFFTDSPTGSPTGSPIDVVSSGSVNGVVTVGYLLAAIVGFWVA